MTIAIGERLRKAGSKTLASAQAKGTGLRRGIRHQGIALVVL